MININDVKCEYILKQGNDLIDCTEEIKAEWADMTKEEREGWYTTKPERLRVKACGLRADLAASTWGLGVCLVPYRGEAFGAHPLGAESVELCLSAPSPQTT